MSDGCAKCDKPKRDGLVGCEGSCQNWFHYSCAGFTETEFQFLNKSSNVIYLCSPCKKQCLMVDQSILNEMSRNNTERADSTSASINNLTASVMQKLSDFEQLFSHFKTEILTVIKNNVLTSRHQDFSNFTRLSSTSEASSSAKQLSASQQPRLYSSVTSNSQSILIQPKNTSQKYSETKANLFHNIHPIKDDVRVSNVKPISKGGLVVSCPSKEEAAKFKSIVSSKLSAKYDVKDLSRLHPRVRIFGLSENHDKSTLADLLMSQNNELLVADPSLSVISITSCKSKPHIFQAVIQLSERNYYSLLGRGRVNIGYDSCYVFDGVEVIRCFNCCGYNHTAKFCKSEPICSKCAGLHSVKDCVSSLKKCINCISASKVLSDIDFNHVSSDKLKCRTYMHKLAHLKTEIFNDQ